MKRRFGFTGRWMWAAGAIGVLVLGSGYLLCRTWWPAPITVPEPDLGRAPAAVRQKLRSLRDAVYQNPRTGSPWGRLGMCLMAHHYLDEADYCFLQAVEFQPAEIRWRYYRAVLLEETDLAASADAYASTLEMEGKYGAGRLRYATVLLRLNRTDEAREQYEQVIRFAPQEHYPYLALGRLAIAAADWDQATVYLEAAVERAEWSRAAHTELARVYLVLHDYDAAFRAQQTAARLPEMTYQWPDPLLAEVEEMEAVSRQLAYQADELVARGDVTAAIRAYRQLVKRRPEMPRPQLNLARVLQAQGQVEEAMAIYRNLIDRFPRIAEGYLHLGLALEAVHDTEGAMASYRDCVERKSDFAEAHFAMGLLLEQQGKLAEAIEAYRRAVESGPQFAPAHLAFGVALHRAGDVETALHHVRSAVRLAPGDPTPQKYLDQYLEESTRTTEEKKEAGPSP
ncbi:MAG: tetratricopeptide repeat protein [Pirellulaceae bacterium]